MPRYARRGRASSELLGAGYAVGRDGLLEAFDGERPDLLGIDKAAHQLVGALVDYDLARLGDADEARGEVHLLSDDGVFHAVLGADRRSEERRVGKECR